MFEIRSGRSRAVMFCVESQINGSWRIRSVTQEGVAIEEPEYELTREQLRTLGHMLVECAIDEGDRNYDGREVLTNDEWLARNANAEPDIHDEMNPCDVPE